jgi:hypothetical protein
MAGELQLLPLAEEGDPLLDVVGVPEGVSTLAFICLSRWAYISCSQIGIC